MVKVKLFYRNPKEAGKIANVVKRLNARMTFVSTYKPWLDENKIYYIFDPVELDLSMEPEDMVLFKLKFNV